MIQLNDTTTASINVLAEDELDQVVGGHCRGGYKRRGEGYGHGYGHCGGRRDNDKYGRNDYDKGGYRDSSDDRGSDDSSSFSQVNQAISLDITINQVAG